MNSFTHSFEIIAASPEMDQRQPSAEDLDSAFEEAADLMPAGIPSLSDEALSRESIYTREDEWNKNYRAVVIDNLTVQE